MIVGQCLLEMLVAVGRKGIRSDLAVVAQEPREVPLTSAWYVDVRVRSLCAPRYMVHSTWRSAKINYYSYT